MELSIDIIQAASRYLGPEAKRFLDRQMSHIDGGAPSIDGIRPQDVEKLAWWVNVSAKLIMDKDKAKELSLKIAAFAEKKTPDTHAQ